MAIAKISRFDATKLFDKIEGPAVEELLIVFYPKHADEIKANSLISKRRNETSATPIKSLNIEWIEGFLEKEGLPVQFKLWLSLIKRFAKDSMRDAIEDAAKATKYPLKRKVKDNLTNESWVAWLLINDLENRVFEFLERVAFQSETEKRKVYFVARAKGLALKLIEDVKFHKIVEKLRLEHANNIVDMGHIPADEKDAVCVFFNDIQDGKQIIIRYPGQLEHRQVYEGKQYTSIVFQPVSYVSMFVRDVDGQLEVAINIQEGARKYKDRIRKALGNAFSNSIGAFQFVKKLITLKNLWNRPLKETFRPAGIANLTFVRLAYIMFTESDGKNVDNTERVITSLIKISKGASLSYSKKVENLKTQIMDAGGAQVERIGIYFGISKGVKTDVSEKPVEIKERGEYKFDQKNHSVVYAWLEKQGFIEKETSGEHS